MEKFSQILIDILATVLSAALVALIRSGIVWVGTKVKSEKMRLALQELQTVLEDGIGYIEQTFVRSAKAGNTWDSAAKEKALELCRDYVLGNLTEKTLDLLTEDKEEIISWLTAKIESQIHYSKPPKD